MKKNLLLMAAAALLLMTQCRKDEMSAVMPETNTVNMTVTVGPGRTDISAGGGIVWSTGDKLYVGENGKCIGCLTLQSGAGFSQGTFTGDVNVGEGVHTFHFFYLGSKDYTEKLTVGSSTEIGIDFSNQNITADNNGKLNGAGAFHVGYGKVEDFKVVGNIISGINVTMRSQVAIACFSFTEAAGKTAYDGALVLRGNCSGMTVNFNGSFTGVKGDINLAGGNSTKYVMLVPQETPSSVQLEFGGNVGGATTLPNGIEANKFYGMNSPIEVSVTKINPVFSVGANKKVLFSPGNLCADGGNFGFYDCFHDGEKTNLFYWSNDSEIATAITYDEGEIITTREYRFFTNMWKMSQPHYKDFTVNGEQNKWYTLSSEEWNYLLNSREGYCYALVKVGDKCGMLVFPDNFWWPSGVDKPAKFNADFSSEDTDWADWNNVTTYSSDDFGKLKDAGVVFLPALGYRKDTKINGSNVLGWYWASDEFGMRTLDRDYFYNSAYLMHFGNDDKTTTYTLKNDGCAVRLVCDVE
ncbi:MAG: hypothetical protein MJ000_07460 [Bacteroidales bacterium]|nr:hypothetical protein [Bacteroidales bacterium]